MVKQYIYADNRSEMRYRLSENDTEQKVKLEERKAPFDDPFALLVAVIRNEITLPEYDLSSLENNMIVIEILEAAKVSSQTGQVVKLN